MKNITDLLKEYSITGLSYDSRKVKKGDLFFAIKGHQVDGHTFLKDVYEKGALAAVVEKKTSDTIPQIEVPSSEAIMADIADQFYDHPSQKIPVIGITGTNGKTTVTYLIESLFVKWKKQCGVMGTINYRIGDDVVPAPNTTPMSMDVHAFISKNSQKKSTAVVMEVSSHALSLGRVKNVQFEVGVFTNLTQDHLDFHKDMEDYFNAKKKLFEGDKVKTVCNVDDAYGMRLFQEKKNAIGFGESEKAHIRSSNAKLSLEGISFDITFPSGKSYTVSNNLLGHHNISNCLAAAAAMYAFGIKDDQIVDGLNGSHAIPGRLERVEAGQNFVIVVDYAHTHDALAQVLKALRETNPKRLLCLLGAGGDRDRSKRPKMGRVAVDEADFAYVTSDNPRTEDPQKILNDVEAGIKEVGKKNYVVIADRREAIQKMIHDAKPGDILLIAGKGHEDYQIVGTKKHHFSDQEEARKVLTQ